MFIAIWVLSMIVSNVFTAFQNISIAIKKVSVVVWKLSFIYGIVRCFLLHFTN